MEIYVVVSNGDLNGKIEGAFSKLKDARAKLKEVKQEWLDWIEAAKFVCDARDWNEDYFSMTINHNLNTVYELSIEKVKLN